MSDALDLARDLAEATPADELCTNCGKPVLWLEMDELDPWGARVYRDMNQEPPGLWWHLKAGHDSSGVPVRRFCYAQSDLREMVDSGLMSDEERDALMDLKADSKSIPPVRGPEPGTLDPFEALRAVLRASGAL